MFEKQGRYEMEINETVLKSEERAMLELRALYKRYGYSQYKMSKFEEYDLYVKNKEFLTLTPNSFIVYKKFMRNYLLVFLIILNVDLEIKV